MAKKFTWGEALDLTLKTKWAGKAALKTNKINTGHFTALLVDRSLLNASTKYRWTCSGLI